MNSECHARKNHTADNFPLHCHLQTKLSSHLLAVENQYQLWKESLDSAGPSGSEELFTRDKGNPSLSFPFHNVHNNTDSTCMRPWDYIYLDDFSGGDWSEWVSEWVSEGDGEDALRQSATWHTWVYYTRRLHSRVSLLLGVCGFKFKKQYHQWTHSQN